MPLQYAIVHTLFTLFSILLHSTKQSLNVCCKWINEINGTIVNFTWYKQESTYRECVVCVYVYVREKNVEKKMEWLPMCEPILYMWEHIYICMGLSVCFCDGYLRATFILPFRSLSRTDDRFNVCHCAHFKYQMNVYTENRHQKIKEK